MFFCDLSPGNVLYNPESEEVKFINVENSIASEGSNVEPPKVHGQNFCNEQVLRNKNEKNNPPKARDLKKFCKADLISYCLHGKNMFERF